ncbi:peptide deformylase, mitochondrial-like [Condylostylus longicornis]|uniref:peptide deformylase, mitochondrial-like n=1 Tax=Condylostylus longicornis TaxID=2530218 RepID=UPI00244DCF32|nr:peptide deformylase, mitochondrial-like [Condylostylus longicornis]
MLLHSFKNKLLLQNMSINFKLHNRNFLNRIAYIIKNFTEPKLSEPPFNHITQIGDPILRKRASSVPEDSLQTNEVKLLIDQMIKVLRKYQLVGIAAPQIGISLRIMVMEFSEKPKDQISSVLHSSKQMQNFPLKVFINPEMKITNYNKISFEEGCASVKGFTGEVDRYEEIILSGFDIKGEKQNVNLKGWNARIAQHEMDHLNGALYIDKMNSRTFRCTLWETINANGGRIEIPYYK